MLGAARFSLSLLATQYYSGCPSNANPHGYPFELSPPAKTVDVESYSATRTVAILKRGVAWERNSSIKPCLLSKHGCLLLCSGHRNYNSTFLVTIGPVIKDRGA